MKRLRNSRPEIIPKSKSSLSPSDICFIGTAAMFEAAGPGSNATDCTEAEEKAIRELQVMADNLTDRELAKVLLVGSLILGRRLEAKENGRHNTRDD
jgi:hypothetical protein